MSPPGSSPDSANTADAPRGARLGGPNPPPAPLPTRRRRPRLSGPDNVGRRLDGRFLPRRHSSGSSSAFTPRTAPRPSEPRPCLHDRLQSTCPPPHCRGGRRAAGSIAHGRHRHRVWRSDTPPHWRLIQPAQCRTARALGCCRRTSGGLVGLQLRDQPEGTPVAVPGPCSASSPTSPTDDHLAPCPVVGSGGCPPPPPTAPVPRAEQRHSRGCRWRC